MLMNLNENVASEGGYCTEACCQPVNKLELKNELVSNRYFVKSTPEKLKTYKLKADWQCYECNTYCNSQLQYEVHKLSQKHKARLLELAKPTAIITDDNKTSPSNVVASAETTISLAAKTEPLTVNQNKPKRSSLEERTPQCIKDSDTADDLDENNNELLEMKPKKCKPVPKSSSYGNFCQLN